MESRFESHASRALAALLALAVCTGIAQANTTLLNPTATVGVTCDTHTGNSSTLATVVVKPTTALTGTATIGVGVLLSSVPAGIAVVAVGTPTLTASNSTAGITFTVAATNAGCAGYTSGTPMSAFNFTADPSTTSAAGPTTTTDRSTIPTVTVTTSSSGLSLTASTFAVSCVKTVITGANASTTYAPGPAVTVAVSSTSNVGTAFTVDTSVSTGTALPAWLTVTPASGGTATTTASVPLTLVPPANCGGATAAVNSPSTVTLANLPGTPKTFTVTMTLTTVTLAGAPLTAAPAAPTLSYTKKSGTPGRVSVLVTSATTPAPYFNVDPTTLPVWLTVDSTSGTAGAGTLISPGKTLNFSTTSACDNIAPGTYKATVGLGVSGYGAAPVVISLLINNTAPTLTIAEGTTRPLVWQLGTALPTVLITAVSTDSPIPFTIATAGPLAPIVAPTELTGLAYSFGTAIPVTFNPLVFASAQPGSTLTGTVSLTWGNPATTTVITLNFSITAPGASATSVSPASLATALSSITPNYPVVLSGTGFVVSSDPTQQTKVGIVMGSGGAATFVADPNITWHVTDASHINVNIAVPPSTDNNLPFSPTGAGGTVNLGVCNPGGSTTTCTAPTGAVTSFTIGNGPIIQAVSSASTFAQVSGATVQNIAPYDMLSIFGSNFCSSGGTGCTSATVLSGAPSQVLTGSSTVPTLQYPNFVTPDTSSTPRKLQVAFWTTASTPVLIGYAPILFATNNQINVIAPAALSSSISSTVSIVVGFGTTALPVSSSPYVVNVVATDPGIYTVGSDGQGGIAALNGANYSVIGPTNPAGVRLTTNSDSIQIYVTGLGVPDSTTSNAAAGSTPVLWPGSCVSATGSNGYLSTLNAAAGLSGSGALTTLDGVIIQSSLLNTNLLPPCIKTADIPTVKVGNITATVSYAGWVADSVAGLYQMNVKLPVSTASFLNTAGTAASVATPVQVPIVITSNSVPSQTGATIWISQQLAVTPPAAAGNAALTGTVGVAWTSTNNTVGITSAAGGTAPITYALTSGLLPAGLTLSSTGVIAGTPQANTAGTYPVTVTATDSSVPPLTGSTSFTLTINGGLYVTSSTASPISATFGTPVASLTTVSASGGTYPYMYAISYPGTIPAGLSVNATTGVVSTSSYTPAGNYNITVTATDANMVTGSVSFTVNVAMQVTNTTPLASPTHPTAGAVTTISVIGNNGSTGSLTYTLDPASVTAGFTISGGVLSSGASTTASGGPYTVIVTVKDSVDAPGAITGANGYAVATITISSVVIQ